MTDNPPVDIQELGQSIWYDNISRHLLKNGELKRLIDEDGVMGVTSNPTIFMKAIADSSDYDSAIETMLDLELQEIYEKLVIEDIRTAADLLRPVYDRTAKVDGYVSLEISPLVADDTTSTLSEARRLFQLVDRSNVMIKIPATEAGLPAIEEAIAEGININITLIFSIEIYKKVMESYLRGLERRLEAGQSVDGIASVASFFVSRIDTAVDLQLQNNIRASQGRDLDKLHLSRGLLGAIAIANAKVAYQEFKKVFESKRFAKLKEAGAMLQRPLWASTGTKNPTYSDTLYVDNLIGAHTVNTVPPSTLKAFKKHGTVNDTLEQDARAAHTRLRQLKNAHVNLEHVTTMLQVDGVDAFAISFEKLLRAIEGKRAVLQAGVIKRQRGIIGGYEPAVRRKVAELAAQHANQKIWDRDASWWKEDPRNRLIIERRFGWLTCLQDECFDLQRLLTLRDEVKSGHWTHAVLVGVGGNSLAPEALYSTFGHQEGFPEMLVLDSTVPSRIKTVEKAIDIKNTLFIVSSKSGATVETEAFRRYFFQKVSEFTDKPGDHFIAITDEGTALAQIAEQDDYRHIFVNPSDMGGRYAALSYFGLVPSAVMGLEIEQLLHNARKMIQACERIIPENGHPGIWLGTLMGYIAQRGHDKLVLVLSPQIAGLEDWIEKLVAESTGKEGTGIFPVAGATIGNPHDYDDDRFIVYMRLDGEPNEQDNQVRALWEAGHPTYIINIPDKYAIAGEFFRWQFATIVAAKMLGVNPFDEPQVSESKKSTETLLEYYVENGGFPRQEPFIEDDNVAIYVNAHTGEILEKICEQRNYSYSQLAGLLAAHISFARSNDYIALMVYMEPTERVMARLEKIRRKLRHATTRAVALGYGPRFLYTTGQFHKAGPPRGIFLQITADDEFDIDVPGQPYSFSILKQAQAISDQEDLIKREVPFIRWHIKGDAYKGLKHILEAIKATLEKKL